MHRNYLLNLLENYTPSGEEELCKWKIIKFVRKEPDCFKRGLRKGHITASSWLLNKAGDMVLLMHHRKLDKWLQLGGHADGDSNVLQVAIREAQEESGIKNIEPIYEDIFDLDVHYIPKIFMEEPHLHYDIRFLLQVKSDEVLQANHESKELRWFDKDPLNLPTRERSIHRMFYKWINL